MRYFIDTEYIERGAGKPIDLISIALVAEDGREFYAISTDFKERHASQWVKENVIAKLPERHVPPSSIGFPDWELAKAWKSREQIAADLITFLGSDEPEFWGWCCGYDYVVVSQLIGFDNWPTLGLPFYFNDIQQEADRLGVTLESQMGGNHNALSDARWIRHLYWSSLFEQEQTAA